MSDYLWAVPLAGVCALAFAFLKSAWVNKQDVGSDNMREIAGAWGEQPDDPRKRHPLDFVLWRPAQAGEPAWEARWRHRGRSVRARPPGGAALEGLALGVDAAGALLLDTGAGPAVRVTAGDVEAL